MKKMLAVLLIFAMLIGTESMAAACGSKKQTGNDSNNYVEKYNSELQKASAKKPQKEKTVKIKRVALIKVVKTNNVVQYKKHKKRTQHRKTRYRKNLRTTTVAYRSYRYRYSSIRTKYRQSNVKVVRHGYATKYRKVVKHKRSVKYRKVVKKRNTIKYRKVVRHKYSIKPRKVVKQRKRIRYRGVVKQNSCGSHSNCHGTDPHGYSKTSKSKVYCGCANMSASKVSSLKSGKKNAYNGGTGQLRCGKHSNCHGDAGKAHENMTPNKSKGSAKTGKPGNAAVKPKPAPKVLVFRDSTCEHCRKISPKIESVEKSYRDKIQFVNYNNTLTDEKCMAAADKYGLEEVPAVVFINSNGTVADKMVGYRDDAAKYISAEIDKLLKQTVPAQH
jgi:thiol-disulfide isomerase/thioredoxin